MSQRLGTRSRPPRPVRWVRSGVRRVRSGIGRALRGRGRAALASSERAALRPGDPNGLRRLHVGCGPNHHLAAWWNVDIRPFPGVDEVFDAARPWPWSGLDAVYGEHLLEHLEPGEAWRLLLEAGRALRPGGVIRLSTPSLEWVMKAQYDDDPDLPRDRAITQTYTINRAFRGWGHRFLYSRPMLERLLHGAGFGDLRFERYGDSERPDLRGLEHHEDHGWAGGFQHVWIVEATRGPDPLVISDELPGELEREFGRYVASGH